MKIRTNFVTNSSSYSSAEIIIDNPVLLEILQRYKEMGVFGEAELDFDIGSVNDSKDTKGTTKTPAFFYADSETARTQHPVSLDDVLVTIIEFMDDSHFFDEFNQGIYQEMKEELLKRKNEIKRSYSRIIWTGGISGFSSEELEIGDECEWSFQYDPENGEKNNVEYYLPLE